MNPLSLYVPNASTATKTDIPLRDIPGSIQVVPNQVLEDRQITGVREAVSTVSGVTPGGDGTLSTIGESFIFRGKEKLYSHRHHKRLLINFNSWRVTKEGYTVDIQKTNLSCSKQHCWGCHLSREFVS